MIYLCCHSVIANNVFPHLFLAPHSGEVRNSSGLVSRTCYSWAMELVKSFVPIGRRLNHWQAIGDWRLHFVRESWRGGLVDGRIVDLRIADHAHEEGPFLGQGLLFLAVQDLGQLVVVVLGKGSEQRLTLICISYK